VSQQVWHVKEPSLIKAISVKLRSKFATPSPVMVTAARLMKIARAAINNNKINTTLIAY
jgi:hypothetical protein